MIARLALACSGLAGAAGVALAARASHGGGEQLRIAADFLLLHAAAFLALGGVLWRESTPWRSLSCAMLLMLTGLVFFAGDLVMRGLAGERLFPMAAPVGGGLMILGWLAVALAAVLRKKSANGN